MYEELVQALRHCVFGDCIDCSYRDNCASLNTQAANAIEELKKKLYSQDITTSQILEMYMPLFIPKWIPVTERLPEPYKEVLFCGKYIYGGVQISYGYCEPHPNNSIKWIDMIDNEIPIDPTHWMPLPDPPKEE